MSDKTKPAIVEMPNGDLKKKDVELTVKAGDNVFIPVEGSDTFTKATVISIIGDDSSDAAPKKKWGRGKRLIFKIVMFPILLVLFLYLWMFLVSVFG